MVTGMHKTSTDETFLHALAIAIIFWYSERAKTLQQTFSVCHIPCVLIQHLGYVCVC